MASSSFQFLQYLQNKKKSQSNEKTIKLDMQEMQHRIQIPTVKMEKQRIKISQDQFRHLIKISKSKFIIQPSLLKIDGPIFIATGTYGSYKELSLILEKCGNPKFVNYLFLGDYTGVYDRQIQCLTALMTYKIKHPFNFFMLRGCYETIETAMHSKLAKQVAEYFGSLKVMSEICELFCCLPFAATIFDQVFCVHGGISPYLFNLQQINKIHRPINTTTQGLPRQLVQAQPFYQQSSQQQLKNIGKFTQKDSQSFLKKTNLKLICRGHSISQHGFQFIFNKSVVNLCSISNFKNQFMNSSAVLMVDDAVNVIAKQITSSNSLKNQQNQEGLTFEEIVSKRQQKKSKIEENQRSASSLNQKNQDQ